MPAGECGKHPGTKFEFATTKRGLNYVRCPKCFAEKQTVKAGGKDAAKPPAKTTAKVTKKAPTKAPAKAAPPTTQKKRSVGFLALLGIR
jgi:rubredoxin